MKWGASRFERQQPAQHIRLLGGSAFAAHDVIAIAAEPFLGPGRVDKALSVEGRRQRADGLAGRRMLASLGGHGAMARGATPFAAVVGSEELLAPGRHGRRTGLGGVAGQQCRRSGRLGNRRESGRASPTAAMNRNRD
jgi:hypothetical protein